MSGCLGKARTDPVTEELIKWQVRLEANLNELPNPPDGAHDIGHCRRVWRHAQSIADRLEKPPDRLVLLAAAYLHDVVSLRKDDPLRATASRLSAEQASKILQELEFPADRIDAVAHAIEAHSHSAGIHPQTQEAEILQDADRLEVLGAIGAARLFHAAGRKGGKLFHPSDPTGRRRNLDEGQYALDHYYLKLRHVTKQMNTKPGRDMARERSEMLDEFVNTLVSEASDNGGISQENDDC